MVGVTCSPSLIHPFRHYLIELEEEVVAAETSAVPLPLASLIRDHFLTAIAHGQGEIDWAGLAQVAAENAGLNQQNRRD